MASIAVGITEDPRVAADARDLRQGNVFKQSLSDLSRWLIALGSVLVAFIVSGVPVLVVYGLILWLAYKLGRMVTNRLFRKRKK
jgi:lauroyl/myristoyl acyltransferase